MISTILILQAMCRTSNMHRRKPKTARARSGHLGWMIRSTLGKFQQGNKWLPGTITKSWGCRSFLIRLDQGATVKAQCTETTEVPEDGLAFGSFNLTKETEEHSGTSPNTESPATDSGLQRSSRIQHSPGRFTPGTN